MDYPYSDKITWRDLLDPMYWIIRLTPPELYARIQRRRFAAAVRMWQGEIMPEQVINILFEAWESIFDMEEFIATQR